MHDSTGQEQHPDTVEPRWRQDFPIEQAKDHYVARRDFTKFMVLISFAFGVGQVWIGVQNWLRRRQGEPPVREITTVDQLAVGAALQFHYPTDGDNALLLRLDEQTFVAYRDQCTHLMCAVRPRFDTGQLHCPCHEGFFEMATGRAIKGPPRRPLPQVTLKISGGVIYATGVEVRTT